MELEIKVMWCKGLSAFNFFQNLTVYAAVSITPEDNNLKLRASEKQEQKTPIDQEGNGNPEWNYTIKFDLSPSNISSNINHLSLVFELKNHGGLFGDKVIGEVRVPLKDLVESVGAGVGRLVSYEVRGQDGKHNGVLDFSYKVINKVAELGNCVRDEPQIQISRYGMNYTHQESHGHSHGSFPERFSSSESERIEISGYGTDQFHQESHNFSKNSWSFQSEKVEYPKIDDGMTADPNPNPNLNPNPNSTMPSFWPTSNHPPGPPSWGPPPPPPRFPPPPPQQPYTYLPPPYGDPYWAYHRPPPNYQQPTGGGGYQNRDYRHW